MAMSDPLGDMLTRIRNGQMAQKSAVKAPGSKLRENVLEVLRRGATSAASRPTTSAAASASSRSSSSTTTASR